MVKINKGNLLIVEDEYIIAMNLEMQLENKFYNVLGIESSGESTIKKLNQIKPDLIIMDYSIKGDLDGIETTEIINEKYQIPVLFVTAHNDEYSMEKIKNSSAMGIITKPIVIDELDKKIQDILSKRI